jgi:hypothetical protein
MEGFVTAFCERRMMATITDHRYYLNVAQFWKRVQGGGDSAGA